MTLKPDVAHLLTHPVVVIEAENYLRQAVTCLHKMRQEPANAARWLMAAEEACRRAWRRLDEGADE